VGRWVGREKGTALPFTACAHARRPQKRKPRTLPARHPYLTAACWPRPDADGGDAELGRNCRGNHCRHALEHHSTASHLLQPPRLAHHPHCLRGGLGSRPAQAKGQVEVSTA
jgi:hypothetical protein